MLRTGYAGPEHTGSGKRNRKGLNPHGTGRDLILFKEENRIPAGVQIEGLIVGHTGEAALLLGKIDRVLFRGAAGHLIADGLVAPGFPVRPQKAGKGELRPGAQIQVVGIDLRIGAGQGFRLVDHKGQIRRVGAFYLIVHIDDDGHKILGPAACGHKGVPGLPGSLLRIVQDLVDAGADLRVDTLFQSGIAGIRQCGEAHINEMLPVIDLVLLHGDDPGQLPQDGERRYGAGKGGAAVDQQTEAGTGGQAGPPSPLKRPTAQIPAVSAAHSRLRCKGEGLRDLNGFVALLGFLPMLMHQ